MLVGVIGLGLIGGSMAKAINQNTGHSVYGYDINESVGHKAVLVGATEGILSEKMLEECDLLILGLYPRETVKFVREHADKIKKGAVVMDVCGIKGYVCDELFPLAKEKGFTFIGAHPMAGVEHMGFEYSKKALFNGAPLILVPATGTPIEIVDEISRLAKEAGFSQTPVLSPEDHDRIIAFTSQLAHVVSSAYVKSPTASEHEGFSAGSYRDMTRVAKLNEVMWAELFMENPDNLADEIDSLCERLETYSKALRERDEEKMTELLREGRERKLEIDKEIF